MLADIAELFLGAVGVVEIVAFLQDGAMLGDSTQRAATSGLAGEPVAFAVAIDEKELGITVVGNPDAASGYAAGAAQGNEQRSQLFAIAVAVGEAFEGTFDRAVLIFDLLARCIVDGFNFFPVAFALGRLFRKGNDFGVDRFDQRAGAQEWQHVFGQFFLGALLVNGSIFGRVNRRASDFEAHEGVRLFAGGQGRDRDDHLLDATFERAIGDVMNALRQILFARLYFLFGPVGGNGNGGDNAAAGSADGLDLDADFDGFRLGGAERWAIFSGRW